MTISNVRPSTVSSPGGGVLVGERAELGPLSSAMVRETASGQLEDIYMVVACSVKQQSNRSMMLNIDRFQTRTVNSGLGQVMSFSETPSL